MVVVANTCHMGCPHNAHRFCAHSGRTLRSAFPPRRGGGGFFSRRHCFSFPLVHLSGPGQGGRPVYVGYFDRFYSWWGSFRRDTACLLARTFLIAVGLLFGGGGPRSAW